MAAHVPISTNFEHIPDCTDTVFVVSQMIQT